MTHKLGLRLLAVPALFALAALVGCGGAPEEAPPEEETVVARLEGLTDGWNTIEPGGETICSDGSPYRFFVRPADPTKVLFYLQGGGGCWFGGNCDPDLEPTYKIDVSEDDPAQAHGIFAFQEADNPFSDYSVVMAPYCTADVHIGDVVKAYAAPETDEHEAHDVTIHHRGWTNGRDTRSVRCDASTEPSSRGSPGRHSWRRTCCAAGSSSRAASPSRAGGTSTRPSHWSPRCGPRPAWSGSAGP